MCMHMPQHTSKSQKMSPFSPFTVCVPGIKLRSSGLTTYAFIHWAIYLLVP